MSKRNYQTFVGGHFGHETVVDPSYKVYKGNSTTTRPLIMYSRFRSPNLTRYSTQTYGRRKRAFAYKKALSRSLLRRALKPPKPERKFLDQEMQGAGAQTMYPDDNGVNVSQLAYNPFTNLGTIYSQVVGTPYHVGGILLTQGLVQGVGISQRVGRKIVIDTITANFNFAPNFDDTTLYHTGVAPTTAWSNRWNYVVRAMLVVEVDPIPGITTGLNVDRMLEYSSATKEGGNTWSSLNMVNAGRYKVLMDKTFHIDQDSGQRTSLRFTKKVRIPVTFTGNSGAQTSVTKNAVYLIFLHDGPDSNGYPYSNKNDPRVAGMTRIRYYDN